MEAGMLENIDLTRSVAKPDYKEAKAKLELRLAELQRQALEQRIPIVIVFEGWGAAGKGTLINDLILPLDPRGFTVFSTLPPNEEESLRPFLWRFWTRLPARGRIALFDRGWYRRVLNDRLDRLVGKADLKQAYQDIRSFERQLVDDRTIIIKFFLHISRKEQKERFRKLRRHSSTAWRVSKDDLRQNKNYDKWRGAVEDMLAETDSDIAPWTIIESHDHRFAALKMFNTVVKTLESRLEGLAATPTKAGAPARVPGREKIRVGALDASILDGVDLSLSVPRDEYRKKLDEKQDRLRLLEHELYMHRRPVVILFEGWDAAGKGGNIRRLVQNLDPRGYEVVPVAAPNDVEKAHHYLWRFWRQIPKAGHITIFDRTWYGRVLVERVEGFCSEAEWKRAYREINEMEQHLTNFGAVLVKCWLHIDPAEQLRRFREREKTPHKRWKITDEDWRNRQKWDAYKAAVEEMLFRTSTPCAPWTIVESNCKLWARLKVLDTVIDAIEKKL
jgi:polyphosphate:AMP phosphotransferase